MWALVVLGVIALAHVGFFLLLTVDAQQEIAKIEEGYDAADLEGAEDPGPPPRGGHEPGRQWNIDRRTWEDARTHRDHVAFVRMLGYGLLGSFLVQAGILGVLLHRSVRSAQRGVAARGRRARRRA